MDVSGEVNPEVVESRVVDSGATVVRPVVA